MRDQRGREPGGLRPRGRGAQDIRVPEDRANQVEILPNQAVSS